MVELLDRKLVFVTGKGGVGKTTIAAALGVLAASKGKRTLLCEMDAKGDLASSFETGPTRFEEREVAPNLWVMSMDTEASLRQYLSLHLRFGRAAYVGPLAKMFDFVASAAPGVREIASVGKLCWEVRERHYDIVVVDSVASGHIIGHLAAPQAINRLVQVGLIRQQTDWMLDILSDPKTSGVLAVTTPEEMPVSETVELIERLEAETTVALAGSGRQPRTTGALRHPRGASVRGLGRARRRATQLTAALGGPAEPLLEAARLMVKMRRARAAHLDRLREVGRPALAERLVLNFSMSRLCSCARMVCAPPTRWRRRWPRSWTFERGQRARHGKRRPPSKRFWRPKKSSVVCGPGGVGKTTIAAAAAAMAACHQGGKVLVVTVDPARRLAHALGLRQGSGVERVRDSAFAGAGAAPRGELWAEMLDAKQSWDTLVTRHAPDPATAKRILDNPLYQDISSRFVQSHDYIAVERLYELHSEGNYDLIVVDTPPTRNALDFLLAPERTADFFSSRLLRLLTVPYKSRLADVASKPFYYVADRVIGSQFLEDIAEFFILFQTLSDGFVATGARSPAPPGRPAHDLHSGRHPGGHARAGSRGVHGPVAREGFSSRCAGPEPGTARIPARWRARASERPSSPPKPAALPLRFARARSRAYDPGLVERVLKEVGTNFINMSVVANERSESAVGAVTVARRGRQRPRARGRRPRPVRRARGRSSYLGLGQASQSRPAPEEVSRGDSGRTAPGPCRRPRPRRRAPATSGRVLGHPFRPVVFRPFACSCRTAGRRDGTGSCRSLARCGRPPARRSIWRTCSAAR